jgi:transitional endoplasmic reticulum ATPase
VLGVPPPRVAARGGARMASLASVVPEAELEALASRFTAPAAEIARAAETARAARGGRADVGSIATILECARRARGERPDGTHARPRAYRPECLNASADVESIARRLAGFSREDGAVALLLHGLPGTGKTEWAHELGRRLQRPVLVRRASDVESKWVGESEQNLARAFREAADRGAVLLFDEADSFLLDRRGAAWRHELQLTNEFLQQLEAHAGIVACTTNLLDRLDPAVLRRFPLKIEFRPATPAQAALLFEAYFAPVLDASDLAQMRPALPALLGAAGPLTPGDFAAVARRARLTGEVRVPEDAVRLLRDEVALRRGGRCERRVGFEVGRDRRTA